MHRYISLNGKICPSDSKLLRLTHDAVQHGRSIFTTIALLHSKPVFLRQHIVRLTDHFGRLNLNIHCPPEDELRRLIAELATLNDCPHELARVTFLPSDERSDLIISTRRRRVIPPVLKLTESPYPVNSRSPLAGLKTGNYLEAIVSFEDAIRRGFDEAIRTNENGLIVSATLANIFWISEDKIFTPALETGCVAGTTRRAIIEEFPVQEVAAPIAALQNAAEIFVSSAGIGVRNATFGGNLSTPTKVADCVRVFLDSELNRT